MKNISIDEAIKILEKNGIRITIQRKLILETLLSLDKEFCSVNEVAEAVRKKYPHIALSSIYKNLELFAQLGIIGCISVPELEKIYYDTRGVSKAYFICKKCKKIIRNENIELKYNDEENEVEKHYLNLVGKCKNCK